jgi:RNA recognition motif-containing protein
MMSARLYVGNLSGETTVDALKAVFSEHGEVSEVRIVRHRDTGLSRGFAFVTMGTVEQASAAATKMNGAMILGRPLRVNEAGRR